MTPDIVYHGLGYVGLTGAVHFARAGKIVLGYDPDPITVSGVMMGKPRAGDFLSYLHTSVEELVRSGALTATVHPDPTVSCQTHIFAVPTERGGHPDMSVLESAVLLAATRQRSRPVTFIIESTLQPRTIQKLAGALETSGWTLGGDMFLAVCPRRDWFADPAKNLKTLPRVVGGVSPVCTEVAAATLAAVSDTILKTDANTAELVKSLENALLHVPVMLGYQLAVAYPDRNVAEALRLAGTHWRLPSLYLGVGTGGRCVPLGSEYLVRGATDHLGPHEGPSLARDALHWDEQFPAYVAWAAANGMTQGPGKRALVLGIGYRPDFRDAGRSPGLRVAKMLRDGPLYNTFVCDPLWPDRELAELTGFPVSDVAGLEPNVVVLATCHSFFMDLPNEPFWRAGMVVMDGPGAWSQFRRRFRQLGVDYRQVGEAGWWPGWTR